MAPKYAQPGTVTELPDEVLRHIAEYAAEYSPALRAVSRRWRRVVRAARLHGRAAPPVVLAARGELALLDWIRREAEEVYPERLEPLRRLYVAAARLGDLNRMVEIEQRVSRRSMQATIRQAYMAALESGSLENAERLERLYFSDDDSLVHPIIVAVQTNQPRLVEELLCRRYTGGQPYLLALRRAAMNGYEECVDMFFKCGLEYPHNSTYTVVLYTPAIFGAAAGDRPILMLRLLKTARSITSDNFVNAALEGAVAGGHFHLMNWARVRGASTSDAELLPIAVRNGQTDMVKFFLDANVSFDINEMVKCAIEAGHEEVFAILCDRARTLLDRPALIECAISCKKYTFVQPLLRGTAARAKLVARAATAAASSVHTNPADEDARLEFLRSLRHQAGFSAVSVFNRAHITNARIRVMDACVDEWGVSIENYQSNLIISVVIGEHSVMHFYMRRGGFISPKDVENGLSRHTADGSPLLNEVQLRPYVDAVQERDRVFEGVAELLS